MNIEEKDLLEGARRFDQACLAAIYDRYSAKLFAYTLRLLGDPPLAEDCVAETFARFLKALQDGRGPRQFLQAYLYKIAHNWITDLYRRRPPAEEELPEDLPVSDPCWPELGVEQRLQQGRLRAALAQLTPEQRQVVLLRFVEGWENEQVAAVIGKPVGAVKALQHRGLAALRRRLTSNKERTL